MATEKKKIKRYYASMNTETSGVFKADIVDKPAIEEKVFHFTEQKKMFYLAANADRRIITGPALIPDLPIYRCEMIEGVKQEFEIVFTADIIEQAMMRFMQVTQKNMVGVMHQSSEPEKDLFIMECFMSDKSRGISAPKGFEHLPDRTWYLSGKINNDDVWNRVKLGELTGWSIEGLFTYGENEPIISLSEIISKILTD